MFFFFVDALSRAPPPGLMNKGAMRRIHQSNDAVIDVAGKIGGQVRRAKARAEFLQFRHGRQIGAICNIQPPGTGRRKIDPGMAIPLPAGIGGGKDAAAIQRVVPGERGNLQTLTTDRRKAPAMIFAGNGPGLEASAGKWNTAMRATVAQREDLACLGTAQQQGNAQQQRRGRLSSAQKIAAQRRIPIVVEQRGRR